MAHTRFRVIRGARMQWAAKTRRGKIRDSLRTALAGAVLLALMFSLRCLLGDAGLILQVFLVVVAVFGIALLLGSLVVAVVVGLRRDRNQQMEGD